MSRAIASRFVGGTRREIKNTKRGSDNAGASGYDGNPYGKILKAARDIRDALDPTKAPGKIRAFADMSPEEQARMRALYEKPAGDK